MRRASEPFGYLRVKVALDSRCRASIAAPGRSFRTLVVDAVLPGSAVTGGDPEPRSTAAMAPVDQFRASLRTPSPARAEAADPGPLQRALPVSLRVACALSASTSKASPAIASASSRRLLVAVAVRDCGPDRRGQVEHPRHHAVRADGEAPHRQAGHRRVHLAWPRCHVGVPRLPCARSRLPRDTAVEAEQAGWAEDRGLAGRSRRRPREEPADAVKRVNEKVISLLGLERGVHSDGRAAKGPVPQSSRRSRKTSGPSFSTCAARRVTRMRDTAEYRRKALDAGSRSSTARSPPMCDATPAESRRARRCSWRCGGKWRRRPSPAPLGTPRCRRRNSVTRSPENRQLRRRLQAVESRHRCGAGSRGAGSIPSGGADPAAPRGCR